MRSKTYKFDTTDSASENIITIKPHKFPWWILLLLLLLLLLIPVKRNVYVQLENSAGLPVDFALTDFSVPQHWPYNDFDTLRLSDKTDSVGRVVFRDIKRPLWAVIFCNDTAKVTAENSCYTLGGYADLLENYPEDRFKIIRMAEKKVTLPFFVADAETRQPLPEASVTVWINGEEQHLVTDVSGLVEFTAPVCAEINIKAEKEYFYPDTKQGRMLDFIGTVDDDRTLLLRPMKATITIYVKDLKTRQPLPGATVYMNIAGGGQQQKVTTNVNGAALVSFADLRLTEIIDFKSVKTNYADTVLPPATVEEYAQFSDEQRTMYMRPLTRMLTFLNTDGVAPLPGVKNEIYINGQLKYTEYSNANGTFQVRELFATDKISIVSSKTNYVTNSTKVNNKVVSDLNTQDSRTIPLTHNPPPPPPPPANDDLQGRNGKFRVNLKWHTVTDLDLHVIDPCGNEICFREGERSKTCNGHTGFLDVDANAGNQRSTNPAENIFWENPSPGEYTIQVNCYSFRELSGNSLDYTVTVIDGDQRREFRGSIRRGERKLIVIHTVRE